MIVYCDNSEVRVGDLVSLHHQTCIGTVKHIIETPADLRDWNVDESGLIIDTSFGGLVFFSKHSLIDEKVRLVSRAAS